MLAPGSIGSNTKWKQVHGRGCEAGAGAPHVSAGRRFRLVGSANCGGGLLGGASNPVGYFFLFSFFSFLFLFSFCFLFSTFSFQTNSNLVWGV
jgi:hypothetical protein